MSRFTIARRYRERSGSRRRVSHNFEHCRASPLSNRSSAWFIISGMAVAGMLYLHAQIEPGIFVKCGPFGTGCAPGDRSRLLENLQLVQTEVR